MDISVENTARTILRVIKNWLPPRVYGVVYSLTFLVGGLLWVYTKGLIKLWNFLTGQIPQSQLFWPVADDPLWREKLIHAGRVSEYRQPVVESFRYVLRRHGGDLQKLITGRPRNADLQEAIALLKELGDAYGNGREIWPIRTFHIHGEASRIVDWFFAEPVVNLCPRSVKAPRYDRMDSHELTKEVRSLCKALFDEVNSEPARSASIKVLENLFKLSSLQYVRLTQVGFFHKVLGTEHSTASHSSMYEPAARSEDDLAGSIVIDPLEPQLLRLMPSGNMGPNAA